MNRSSLLMLLLLAGCTKPEYSGEFKPYRDNDIISAVNKRMPKDEYPMSETHQIDSEAQAQRVFFECVQARGSCDAGFCLLELDSRALDAAIHLARFRKKIEESDVWPTQVSARNKLLRRGARTFLLVHNCKEVYALDSPEPELISQGQGKGKLVGMSVAIGLGIKAGDVGVLYFENKVSADDASYAVRMNLTFADEPAGLGKSRGFLRGVGECQKLFNVGGDASPLPMLKEAFAPLLPAPAVQTGGLSIQEVAIAGELALRLVRFLKRL